MTQHVLLNALLGLAMLAAVAGSYYALARRRPYLWHPLSIVAAVTAVSIAVALAGDVLFGAGWAGAVRMLRRSAIGGIGWGLVIALAVSITRRGYGRWRARRTRR